MRPNTRVLVRNHHLSGRDVLIRTNDQGFRNAPLEGKQGQRVLFLGDSITLADYLPEEDTFVRLVQDLARSDGRNMETINAGIGAVGTANELAILVERGVALAPDVVVLGFYLNDAQPSPGVQRVRLPRTLEWSWLARRAARVVPRLTGGESEGDLPAATLEAWRAD